MTGTLDETHVHQLRQEEDTEDQSDLFDFSNDEKHTPTTIAVVREPNDTGILEECDEHIPELGMPARVLDDFRKLRSRLNEMTNVEEHNKAFIKCDLDAEYESHITFNEGAQEAIEDIVDRLMDGEDITLVCFEGDEKMCHRHFLKEHIEEQVEDRKRVQAYD